MSNDAILRALDSLDDILASDLESIQPSPRRVLDPNKLSDWDKASEYYEEIRQDESDVEKIAANIGKKKAIVSRVKDHIFYKEHRIVIDDIEEYRRLDEDPEIVNSWYRLRDGDFVTEDENLFCHEQLESILVIRRKLSQTEAHLTTIAAGYCWNPDEAYNGDISNS